MPVADCVERIRAACHAIQVNTPTPSKPAPHRVASHSQPMAWREEIAPADNASAHAATPVRRAQAAIKATSKMSNGRVDMVGAIKYQCPMSMAVIARPSSAPDETSVHAPSKLHCTPGIMAAGRKRLSLPMPKQG